MSEETKDMKKMTEEAVFKAKSDSDKVKDVTGKNTKILRASATADCKEYDVRPVPLEKIPELAENISKIEQIYKKGEEMGLNDYQVITNKELGFVDVIADVITMCIQTTNPDFSKERVMKEFTLSDFPVAYEIALSMNDFLANMRGIGRMI